MAPDHSASPVQPPPEPQQEIACARCGLQMKVDPGLQGQILACPSCGWQFTIGGWPVPPGSPLAAAPGYPSGPGAASTWTASPLGPPAGAGADQLTPTMVSAMGSTKPWAMLIGILWFCGGVFGGIAVIFEQLTSHSLWKSHPGLAVVLLLAGLLATAGSLVVATLLTSYGLACGRFARTRRPRDLESALVAQRKFWQTYGLLAILSGLLGIILGLGLFLFR